MWVYRLDWGGLGQRQVADACECGNEPSVSVKCGEILDQLQTSQLLRTLHHAVSKLFQLVVGRLLIGRRGPSIPGLAELPRSPRRIRCVFYYKNQQYGHTKYMQDVPGGMCQTSGGCTRVHFNLLPPGGSHCKLLLTLSSLVNTPISCGNTNAC